MNDTGTGYRDLPFHERLGVALEKAFPGKDIGFQCRKLREALLAAGAHPHHAAQLTIQRWVTGRGMPPPECMGIFADYLGVPYRWLNDGEGVPDGLKPQAAKAAAARRKAPTTKTVEGFTDEPAPPPKAPEPEVSIPGPDDVHKASTRIIGDYLKATQSVAAVQAVLEHERANPDPRYKGGRGTILRDGERRLKALRGE